MKGGRVIWCVCLAHASVVVCSPSPPPPPLTSWPHSDSSSSSLSEGAVRLEGQVHRPAQIEHYLVRGIDGCLLVSKALWLCRVRLLLRDMGGVGRRWTGGQAEMRRSVCRGVDDEEGVRGSQHPMHESIAQVRLYNVDVLFHQ